MSEISQSANQSFANLHSEELVEYPLVTVNILSFNRKEELRHTLTKVFEQDYKNIEVIVVDNASADGSAEMVEQEFPNVILIKLEKNIGIAGWNKGFEIAKGEYVLVLDDDSYPDINTIRRGVLVMDSNLSIGAVAYNILNLRYNKSETEGFLDNPYFFNGCGALIRRVIFESIGYYSELIFIYYNELEFCARLYDCGFKVNYLKDTVCFHNQSLGSRGNLKAGENPFNSEYRFYHYFISYSIFIMLRINYLPALVYLFKWFANRFLVAIKMFYFYSYFKAILVLIFSLKKIMMSRMTLSFKTQKFYRFGNEALFDRAYFPSFLKSRQ
ncbi:MAG: glycosyltransferase family 2 protein [Ignavibacteriaceae bacterium]|nr:glycosyltransferase family 2 protein [Ignavibacteriaceae bacterium]